jgi:hypothetical protein
MTPPLWLAILENPDMTTWNYYSKFLTDEQADIVNEHGWDGSDLAKAYSGLSWLERHVYNDDLIIAAVDQQIYKHTRIEDIFMLANGYGVEKYKLDTVMAGPSGQVGDIVVNTAGGAGWVCCAVGWKRLHSDTVDYLLNKTTSVLRAGVSLRHGNPEAEPETNSWVALCS